MCNDYIQTRYYLFRVVTPEVDLSRIEFSIS